MDQQKLTALLHQQNTEIGERTPFCPGDHAIAAYFDGKSDHPDRDLAEHHLVNCSYCLARIAAISQLHWNDNDEQVPEPLRAAADQFGHQPRRRLRHAPAWAAAAAVIITLFAVAARGPTVGPEPGGQLSPASPAGEEARQLRSFDRGESGPTILAPAWGAQVRPEHLTIRWAGVPGSLYYDIRLVNEDGFMIWQDRIEANQSKLPDHLELVAGAQYFVRVDAYLAEAKSIRSRHVQFTIKGNH